MANVLQSKRESSRFQILVEIAAHQPNLRQKEVASKLGVTPQAISEYIKELLVLHMDILSGSVTVRFPTVLDSFNALVLVMFRRAYHSAVVSVACMA